MEKTTVTSKQFSLNLNDFKKGLIMAILTPVLAIILDSINAGNLEFNWKVIVGAAVAGAGAYLLKNLSDKPKVVISDVPAAKMEAIKSGEAEATITPT